MQVSKLALTKKKGRRELPQQALEHQSTHNTTQLAFIQSFSFQTFSPFYSSTHSQSFISFSRWLAAIPYYHHNLLPDFFCVKNIHIDLDSSTTSTSGI